MRFGWSTTTYDRAGEPTSEKVEVTRRPPSELEALLERFRGEFLQTPPPVSAKKVDGKRAYELARKSIAVELEPVKVHVYELTLLERRRRRWRACARTARAARTCARSRTIWGRRWAAARICRNCGALASGEFEIDQARTLAQLESLAADERLVDALVPAAKMLPGFPSVFVDDVTVAQIRNGRNFPASPFRSQPAAKYVKAVTQDGELVAIGEAVLPNLYHPMVVL